MCRLRAVGQLLSTTAALTNADRNKKLAVGSLLFRSVLSPVRLEV